MKVCCIVLLKPFSIIRLSHGSCHKLMCGSRNFRQEEGGGGWVQVHLREKARLFFSPQLIYRGFNGVFQR